MERCSQRRLRRRKQQSTIVAISGQNSCRKRKEFERMKTIFIV